MKKILLLTILIFVLLLAACDDSGSDDPQIDSAESAISADAQTSQSLPDEPENVEEPEKVDEPQIEADDPQENLPDEPNDEAFLADCPFEVPGGFDISCGYLIVPENRTISNSPNIELAYAIVYAAEDEGRPPIVYLAGGPGGSAIDDFVADPEGWQYPFTNARDLVLIDQRGTGYSYPTSTARNWPRKWPLRTRTRRSPAITVY